jgi:GAF domain-containing protein
MSDFSELPHITNDQQHNPLPDLLTQLYRFMVAVSEVATPLQIAMLCIDEGVKVLGAATCTVTRLRDNQTVEQIRSTDTIPRQWHSSPIASLHGVETVIQTQQAIWVRSPNECDIYFPNSLAATYQSGVILPLVVSERMIGTIEFAFTVPDTLDVANETFITLFSLQCALAMDRAQLCQQPHNKS